jgi:hypothetical protein
MIVTLCGSARFEPWYLMWTEALGLSGHSVFGLTSYPSMRGGEKEWYTEEEKSGLDALHLRKIDASDCVVVLNPFGYLGESTLREIFHTKQCEKEIRFLTSYGKGVLTTGERYSSYHNSAASRYGVPVNYRAPISTVDLGDVWSDGLLPPAGDLRVSIVGRLERRLKSAMGSP